MPMSLRSLLAVFLAGVAGAIAKALAAAAFVDPGLIRFVLDPANYAVAILVALAIPLSLHSVRGRLAPWTALALMILLPSLLSKFALGAGGPWHLVLSLNAVYGLAALTAYRAVAGGRRLSLLKA